MDVEIGRVLSENLEVNICLCS